MLKKKSLFALIPLLGIFGVGAVCSIDFGAQNVKAAKAEDPVTIQSDIKVKKYRRSDNFDYGVLYENNAVMTQADVETAKTEIANAIDGVDEEVDYTVTTIELLADSDLDYTILTDGNCFEVLLKGHTWDLAAETPWELICEKFTLKGEQGTINALDSEDAAFEIAIEDTNEGKVEITDTTFNDFSSISSSAIEIEGNFEENNGLSVEFANCNFNNCESEVDGGAVSISRAFNILFTNCKFDGCSSEFGGALYIEDILYKTIMNECTFNNCDAENGGAICVYAGGADDENPSMFALNACVATDCSADCGGFAYVEDEGIHFCSLDNDTTIKDCDATSFGGGIYVAESRINVEGFTFENCVSENGGGVYADGASNSVIMSTFKACEALEKGPAIYSKETLCTEDNEYLDDAGEYIDESKAVYIEAKVQPIVQQVTNSNTPIWIMGSLILAAFIAAFVIILVLFKKNKLGRYN